MERDPQLINPAKRELVLNIYQRVRLLYPQVKIRYSDHYEELLKETHDARV